MNITFYLQCILLGFFIGLGLILSAMVTLLIIDKIEEVQFEKQKDKNKFDNTIANPHGRE